MPTIYSPEQITAAHRLHDTCHELAGVLADEPATTSLADSFKEWDDLYGTAYRLHEDAEAEYRHAFPDPATRPEAHEVIAAERNSMVELLRGHIIETVTQIPAGPWGYDDHKVIIDCVCGAVIKGVMPDHLDSTTGSLVWLMAEHVARELLAARR